MALFHYPMFFFHQTASRKIKRDVTSMMFDLDYMGMIKEDKTIETMQNLYEKDFTFIFPQCGKKIQCNRFFADLISSKVNEMHHIDQSITEFEILDYSPSCKKSASGYASQFQLFLKLFPFLDPNNDEKEINIDTIDQNEYQQILELLYSLGNEKIVLKCLSIRKINYHITASNMKDLYLKLKNNYPSILIYTSINKIIDFCASNIDKKETQEMITKYFTKEEIDTIFRSKKFKISDEDSVFELICNIINERGDNFFTLLSHVQFLNLSIKKRHQYLDFIEPTKLDFDDWKTFITRVKSLFGTCILEDSSIIFRPQYGHEFEGIFNYLNKECSGNCATKKLIHVRCSSLKSTSPEFLFDYKTLSSDKFWSLNNENDGYLQIDFKKRKINLSHYSFHTPNNQFSNILSPKNWEIKGSNDKMHWDILDSRKYDPHLKRHNTFYCYECTYKNQKNYQYIRFYQRGVNHGDDYDTHLSGIEFFGKLIN